MKKLLMTLFCVLTLVGLVACDDEKTSNDNTNEDNTQETENNGGQETETPAPTEVVYYGSYTEEFGKNKDLYTTQVAVTVLGDEIVKVEMSEHSNHFTHGSTKWLETSWTDSEAAVLESFKGKSVSAILAKGAVADTKADKNEIGLIVTGATITSNRVYNAIVDALTNNVKMCEHIKELHKNDTKNSKKQKRTINRICTSLLPGENNISAILFRNLN